MGTGMTRIRRDNDHAFSEAAGEGDLERVVELIGLGVSGEGATKEEGETALMLAALKDHMKS